MNPTETTNPSLSPAERSKRLERAVELLSRAGDVRSVVRIVEVWGAESSDQTADRPTRNARLLQVRALLDLRLMDRAWVRVRDFLDGDKEDLEAVILAAEMFVQRGWPLRARRLLADPCERHPDHGLLQTLMKRAQEPPRVPPPNARDLEKTGEPHQRLALAERFLATGSLLRARNILERLHKEDPENARVNDLLWGMQGDFRGNDRDPLALALASIPDLENQLEHHGDDPPPLDDVTATRAGLLDDEAQDVDFPALFRNSTPHVLPPRDEDTAEITQKVPTVTPEDLENQGPLTSEDAPDGQESLHEDTEILMVIQGEPQAPGPDHPTHRRRKQDYNLKETLDLSEWREHMGMGSEAGPKGRLGGSDSDLADLPSDEETQEQDPACLEDEDEEMVVMTRQESRPSSAPAEPRPAPARGPVKVIENYPTPEEPPSDGPELVSGMGAPASADFEDTPPARSIYDEDTVLTRDPFRRQFRRRVAIGAGLGAVTVLLVLVGILVVRFSGASTAEQATRLTRTAMLSDSYESLLNAEATLEGLLGEPGDAAASEAGDPAIHAGLARVLNLLWTDYVNNPQRLSQAHEHLQMARESDPDHPSVHLATAELALVEKRLAAARQALALLEEPDVEVWLDRALLARASGELPKAVAAAEKAHRAAPEALRPLRVLADLYRESGRLEPAQELLDLALARHPENPRVEISRVLLDIEGKPSAQVAASVDALARRLTEEQVPPRIEARIYKTTAIALAEMGETARGATVYKLAFAKDHSDPELLYHFAELEIRHHRYVDALEWLGQAATYQPGDTHIQMALLRLLVGLDRLEQAQQQVEHLAAAVPGCERLPVYRAWIAAVGRDDLDTTRSLLEPYLEEHPHDGEAAWLLGYALTRQGRYDRALPWLERAETHLARASEPTRQALLPYALATLRLAGAPNRVELQQRALVLAPRDPWVYLLLAWSNAQQDRLHAAAGFLDQAHQEFPEFARVEYERAAFFARSLPAPEKTAESAARYLEVSPGGHRAEAARAWLE